MVEGTTCSWSEYLRIWSETTRVPATYRQVSLAEYVDATPDKELGREVWDMWDYCTNPGYDGEDSTLWKAADIRKVCMYLSLFIGILIDLRITQTGLDCPIIQWLASKNGWEKKIGLRFSTNRVWPSTGTIDSTYSHTFFNLCGKWNLFRSNGQSLYLTLRIYELRKL
jgi:hypothetical protein